MDLNHTTLKTYSTLDWKRYLDKEYHPVANLFLEKYGTKIFKYAIDSISKSLKDNTDVITLFTLKKSTIVIVVYRNDYVSLLNSAMNWLIDEEEYELCALIRDMLNDIS